MTHSENTKAHKIDEQWIDQKEDKKGSRLFKIFFWLYWMAQKEQDWYQCPDLDTTLLLPGYKSKPYCSS